MLMESFYEFNLLSLIKYSIHSSLEILFPSLAPFFLMLWKDFLIIWLTLFIETVFGESCAKSERSFIGERVPLLSASKIEKMNFDVIYVFWLHVERKSEKFSRNYRVFFTLKTKGFRGYSLFSGLLFLLINTWLTLSFMRSVNSDLEMEFLLSPVIRLNQLIST